MLFREWKQASLYLNGTYTQNQSLGHGNRDRSTDNTVQTLPELSAFRHKGRLWENIPLEFEGSFTSGYKYRRYGDRGYRTDFSPRVSLPLNSAFGSIIASADLNSTWYNTHASQPGTAALAESRENSRRLAADFDLAASSELSKVYELGPAATAGQAIGPWTPDAGKDRRDAFAPAGPELAKPGDSRWVSLSHSITPRLDYHRRRAFSGQTRNPAYDPYDRLQDVNTLVYSVENSLTRKRATAAVRNKGTNIGTERSAASDSLPEQGYELESFHGANVHLPGRGSGQENYLPMPSLPERESEQGSSHGAEDSPPGSKPEQELYYRIDYLKFLRLKLEHTYDLEEAGREHDLDKYPRRPLRDVMAEAALAWDNRLRFNSKVYWSPYSGDITRWDGGLTLNVPDLGSFRTGLDFRNAVNDYFTQRKRLTMVRFSGVITGFDPLYAAYYYNWSIDGSGEEESGLTLNYNHQCFTFTALLEKDRYETTIGFSVTIAGLTVK
jgi:hypothetical protein